MHAPHVHSLIRMWRLELPAQPTFRHALFSLCLQTLYQDCQRAPPTTHTTHMMAQVRAISRYPHRKSASVNRKYAHTYACNIFGLIQKCARRARVRFT